MGVGARREGLLWALLGVVIFSFSVPLTKVAVGGFDPFLTATGRAVIAGALAVVVIVWRRVPGPPRDQLRPLLVTMLGAARLGSACACAVAAPAQQRACVGSLVASGGTAAGRVRALRGGRGRAGSRSPASRAAARYSSCRRC